MTSAQQAQLDRPNAAAFDEASMRIRSLGALLRSLTGVLQELREVDLNQAPNVGTPMLERDRPRVLQNCQSADGDVLMPICILDTVCYLILVRLQVLRHDDSFKMK